VVVEAGGGLPGVVVTEPPDKELGGVHGAHCAFGMAKLYPPAVVVMSVATFCPNKKRLTNASSWVCWEDGKEQWRWSADWEKPMEVGAPSAVQIVRPATSAPYDENGPSHA
jgi:hypothetical protein